MLHEETLLKINSAIRSCLDQCYSADHPLAAMAQFLDELRQRPDWRAAEVEEVEFTVRRILQAVVTREHVTPEQAAPEESDQMRPGPQTYSDSSRPH